ncbi:MAG: DUF2339 domain-containing protein [Nitrospirae bacterium]|nr:DUF2339 domain-containing protein [Nitrospirota bacterium]
MNCPSCNKPIIVSSDACDFCGYRYDAQMHAKIILYFELRDDINRLKFKIKDEVWEGIKEVSNKLQRYETILDAELRELASPSLQEQAGRRDRQEAPSAGGAASVGEGPVVQPAVKETKRVRQVAAGIRRQEAGREKSGSSHFEVNFGQKWLLIIGIVTMVFGVGYFLKYSFEQGWIGPAGRVSMAYVWGIVFLAAGNLFRKKGYEIFGLYLAGGGIATLYFSTFAAFQLYHLIGQLPSFAIMVLITTLAATLAIVYDTKWLAVLGLIGGFLTPVLLSTGQDNQIALMSYMTLLNLGLLGIAFYKKWDLLNVFGFIFTYLLYAAWFNSHYDKMRFWPSIIFLNVFYVIYSIIPFAYQFFRKESEKMEGFIIILPNSLLAFGGSYYMIRNYAALEWVSVVTISYSVLFLAMASYLARAWKQDQESFVVLIAKAALFLVITIPVIFSKHWITIFWAAQAAVLLWAGIRLGRNAVIYCAYGLLVLAAGKFLAYDYAAVFEVSFFYGYRPWAYTHMLTERLLTSVLVLAALGHFAYLTQRDSLALVSGSAGKDSGAFFALLGIVLFIVLNMETSLFFGDYLPAARFAAISVLWTMFSVVLMMLGFREKSSLLRKISLCLFAVTLGKVFLFDMENISTPYRIISFIILGLVLVGTSYLYYKFKDRIQSAMSAEKS